MRVRLPEIAALGADVVVVTFTKPRTLAGYQRRFADPLTVVTDVDLALYQAFGFGRGSVARVWGWRSAKKYLELMFQGKRPQRAGSEPEADRGREDTLQLGGNVILDSAGRVRWVYAGAGPDDRPQVSELIDQLTALV